MRTRRLAAPAVIALLLVIIEPSVTLFALCVAYVFSGPAEWLWRRHTGERLEEVPVVPGPTAYGHGPDSRG